MWSSFFLPSSVDKQDLLKHTPVDHPDCLPVQDALRISRDFFPASARTLTPLDCSHNGLPMGRIALGRATVLWKVPDPAFCLCILIPDPKYDAADPKQRLLEGSACPVCVTPPPTPSQRGLPQAAPKQPVVLSSSTPCKSHREISVAVCPEHV
ncbi:uncharacterized protein [Macaca nemestrina]|uniref:uncharacterized protein isoform X1 n=1 Tax=Macaca nemestrina TaxID=9545 RepID=UPI0039B962BA